MRHHISTVHMSFAVVSKNINTETRIYHTKQDPFATQFIGNILFTD
jgi:hypothetical protein